MGTMNESYDKSYLESPLAPGLLLAMPHLSDPNFQRTVVLMVEHGDEGSLGLVINRMVEVTIRELLRGMDMEWNGAADDSVWSGGPVMPGVGWLLYQPDGGHPSPDPDDTLYDQGRLLVSPDIALTTCGEQGQRLREFAAYPPFHVRLLLGYAGWGPGQLAFEMSQGSWLHADASPGLIFETPPEDLWDAALATLGVSPATLVQGVGIH